MSYSKSMARRFAMDLSGLSLGMWETARLLSQAETRGEGLTKLNRLRAQLQTFRSRPSLSDSLNIYLKEKFDPQIYEELLNRLEHEKMDRVVPDIRGLVERTREYVNESRRMATDLLRPI